MTEQSNFIFPWKTLLIGTVRTLGQKGIITNKSKFLPLSLSHTHTHTHTLLMHTLMEETHGDLNRHDWL